MIACPFVTAGHPFERVMDQIRRVLEDPSEPVRLEAASRRVVRQHELKGVREANGAFRMDRFYSSLHAWDGAARFPFQAVTFHYSGKTGLGEWFRFPRDPYLAALEHLLESNQAEVLQYVVLRRLTYRAKTAGGATFIGKIKRRSRARGAYEMLSLVSAAAGRQLPSFRLAAPLGHDESRNLFHQECLPGRPVSELVRGDTLDALLHGVGRVQAELHGLAVPGLPSADERAGVDRLSRNCDWIGFFRPADGRRLGAVRRVLHDILPALAPAVPAVCHGDFVCSHVLHGPQGWSVVDFDLAQSADPHADAAILLSSLTNDVPMLQRAWRDPDAAPEALVDRAVAAYLEGYQSYGGRVLERRRLLWHWIAAEIHMLGLMFTKDRLHPLAFERSMGLVERLTGELSRAAERAA